MGGNSSKQSSEVERNRRLREFEEELVDSGHTLQPQYFHQFLEDSVPLTSSNRTRSNKEDSESVDDLFSETESKSKPEENGESAPINDKEVEDAIAELEETFRTLSPEDRVRSGDELNGRSKSCGPLTPFPSTPTQLSGGGAGSRIGTPMGTYPQPTSVAVASHQKNQNHPRLHHRRQKGRGGGVSRSGGLLSTQGGGNGLELSKSAPPYGGSNISEQQWTPPQIQGFDVDKFRQVNKRTGSGSEKRLPTTKSNDTMSSRGDRRMEETQLDDPEKNGKRPSTPYTRDELELLKKLERDVY